MAGHNFFERPFQDDVFCNEIDDTEIFSTNKSSNIFVSSKNVQNYNCKTIPTKYDATSNVKRYFDSGDTSNKKIKKT